MLTAFSPYPRLCLYILAGQQRQKGVLLCSYTQRDLAAMGNAFDDLCYGGPAGRPLPGNWNSGGSHVRLSHAAVPYLRRRKELHIYTRIRQAMVWGRQAWHDCKSVWHIIQISCEYKSSTK